MSACHRIPKGIIPDFTFSFQLRPHLFGELTSIRFEQQFEGYRMKFFHEIIYLLHSSRSIQMYDWHIYDPV